MQGPTKGEVEAQTSQFNSAIPDSSPLDQWGDPTDAGLKREPQLAQGRQQDQTARSCEREKRKEQSKPPDSRDRVLLQAKLLMKQQLEEFQRNLKLYTWSMYCQKALQETYWVHMYLHKTSAIT